MSEKPDRFLTIPLADAKTAYIPLGISQEDYELIKASMELWACRIIQTPAAQPERRMNDE